MNNIYIKLKDKYGGNYLFLYFVIFLYVLISFFDFNYIKLSLIYFIKIFITQIIPILFIVYLFIFIFNLLIQNEKIINKISNSNSITKYIFVILFGIMSTGPVYMWYPMLKKLKIHGLGYEHIATFIYSRAVKIPFFTIMIFYFGIKYTLFFNVTILIFGLLTGISINLISKYIKYENNNS